MCLLFAERADRGRPHVRMVRVRVRVTVGRGPGGCGHREDFYSRKSAKFLVVMFCFVFISTFRSSFLSAESQPASLSELLHVVQEVIGSFGAAFAQPFTYRSTDITKYNLLLKSIIMRIYASNFWVKLIGFS